MKNLFLLYACAEKFRAAKIGAINVSLSPKASMAEFHAAKREDAMKFLEFFRKRVERGLEILKFLSVRNFDLQGAAVKRGSEILKFSAAESLKSRAAPQKRAAEFLNFTPMPCNRFEILKFTRTSARLADTAQNFISKCGFKILKFIHKPLHVLRHALTRALRCTSLRADKAEAWCAAWLTSQHSYDAVKKRRAVKINYAGGYSNFMRRRIVRLRSVAARHGYKTARAGKLSKFDLADALLNFKSRFAMQLCSAITRRNYEAWRSEIYAVCLHKYPALIRAASGKISRYEVGQATNASLSRGVQRMKFYALNRHAIKFLKFLGARRFGLQAAVGRGFEILKFSAAERLKSRAAPQKRAAELLNSSSLSPRKFKLALLKFPPEPSRNRYEILNFTPAPCKFKSAPAVRLNLSLNSIPHARAAKFEHGVKFKGAVKFKRGAR
ncbi:hypothetical protein [uncultured Campylobacter sp.]|uniref:hypothetical protein n=1 Tax=uncultured Campylobacter sp. TaxID=218934 RepID=UPI0028E4FB91|nr:hypothetical protein [uncultured Campylobacter sp.]